MNTNTFLNEKNRMDAILRAAAKNSLERSDERNDNEDFLISDFIDEVRDYVVILNDSNYTLNYGELYLLIKESDSGSCASSVCISQEDLAKAIAEVDAQGE